MKRHLAKVLGKRRNLDFRTSAIVTQVLFDFFGNAIGVECPKFHNINYRIFFDGARYSDEHGKLKKVYATKEVIITAGALQTAKILFVSLKNERRGGGRCDMAFDRIEFWDRTRKYSNCFWKTT
jgi:hypothetical protein